jgi:DnaJ-class molecular chaperone
MFSVFVFCILLLCLFVALSLEEEEIFKKDLYGILGITKISSISEIKRAYRGLAQIYHPDKSKAEEKDLNENYFRDIVEAYKILCDQRKRSEYHKYLDKNQKSSTGGSTDDRRDAKYNKKADKRNAKHQSFQFHDHFYPKIISSLASSSQVFQRYFLIYDILIKIYHK